MVLPGRLRQQAAAFPAAALPRPRQPLPRKVAVAQVQAVVAPISMKKAVCFVAEQLGQQHVFAILGGELPRAGGRFLLGQVSHQARNQGWAGVDALQGGTLCGPAGLPALLPALPPPPSPRPPQPQKPGQPAKRRTNHRGINKTTFERAPVLTHR